MQERNQNNSNNEHNLINKNKSINKNNSISNKSSINKNNKVYTYLIDGGNYIQYKYPTIGDNQNGQIPSKQSVKRIEKLFNEGHMMMVEIGEDGRIYRVGGYSLTNQTNTANKSSPLKCCSCDTILSIHEPQHAICAACGTISCSEKCHHQWEMGGRRERREETVGGQIGQNTNNLIYQLNCSYFTNFYANPPEATQIDIPQQRRPISMRSILLTNIKQIWKLSKGTNSQIGGSKMNPLKQYNYLPICKTSTSLVVGYAHPYVRNKLLLQRGFRQYGNINVRGLEVYYSKGKEDERFFVNIFLNQYVLHHTLRHTTIQQQFLSYMTPIPPSIDYYTHIDRLCQCNCANCNDRMWHSVGNCQQDCVWEWIQKREDGIRVGSGVNQNQDNHQKGDSNKLKKRTKQEAQVRMQSTQSPKSSQSNISTNEIPLSSLRTNEAPKTLNLLSRPTNWLSSKISSIFSSVFAMQQNSKLDYLGSRQQTTLNTINSRTCMCTCTYCQGGLVVNVHRLFDCQHKCMATIGRDNRLK